MNITSQSTNLPDFEIIQNGSDKNRGTLISPVETGLWESYSFICSNDQLKAVVNLKAKATGKGKLTYKVSKYPKNAKKYISVSKKGVVTLKKGAKKGTYKITITAAATGTYAKATKTVTIKVK